jgi:hypothetical protein
MTLMRPAAKLTVDGSDYTAAEGALRGLRLSLGLGTHDAVTAALGPLTPMDDTATGATFEIALGYGDELETVFTGTVATVEKTPSGVILEGVAATWPLARKRVAQSYVEQTVKQIVEDLLGQAEVDAGEIEAPLKLFAYHVDERRTVWSHLLDLARLASCDVICSAAGALDFRPPRSGPSADHTLRYGADLVRWSLGPRDPQTPRKVVPYGAASEEGGEKWHILLREPDGGSPSDPTIVPAALRDRDGAKALEDGLAKLAERRATGGTLLIVGNAEIRPGDVLELSDMPAGEPDLVRATLVTHLLDGAAGFRTNLTVEGVA